MAHEIAIDEFAGLSDEALRPMHISEAAGLTGISRNTLLAEIKDGRLSACRIRGRYYLTRAQLAAWLKRIETPVRES